MSFIPPTCVASGDNLNCEFDSVTICPPASGIFDVHVVACSDAASISEVPASITTVTIVAANLNRCSLIIYNDSTSTLRIKFGTGASSTSYTLQIPGQGSYIMDSPASYTGIITGIWENANGDAHITEVT